MKHKSYGFTVVELLIVIVIIAILAVISIVAYTGMQGKARDSARLQDISNIQKALELYKVTNGNYPAAVGSPGMGGWEISTSGTFLSNLVTSDTVSKVPVDPKNTRTSSSGVPNRSSDWMYFYYRYTAGDNGANPACGSYYVLGVTRFDGVTAGSAHAQSPGFATLSRDWVSTGAYVTGHYANC